MSDTEKITINLSVVDLGQIDLLVEQGLYANRTDLIRTAIRVRLDKHAAVVEQTVTRKAMVVGVLSYNRASLERRLAEGETLDITAIGMLHLVADVTPTLALEVINSIDLYGVLRAPAAVKTALEEENRFQRR